MKRSQELTPRKMQMVEAAWVGAMIEGEGYLGFRRVKTHNYPEVQVTNTSVETIATLLRLTGVGNVHLQHWGVRHGVKKFGWVWTVIAMEHVKAVMLQVIPFLTDKRSKAQAQIQRLS